MADYLGFGATIVLVLSQFITFNASLRGTAQCRPQNLRTILGSPSLLLITPSPSDVYFGGSGRSVHDLTLPKELPCNPCVYTYVVTCAPQKFDNTNHLQVNGFV